MSSWTGTSCIVLEVPLCNLLITSMYDFVPCDRFVQRAYCCHMSPRQDAATNCLVWHVKIIVAAICSTNLNWFLICAAYCSGKKSASSLVAACAPTYDKSLRKNLNQPMREHQLVSPHVKFELVYIFLSSKIDCVHRTSVLSQQQCRWGDLSRWCVAAICRIMCLGLQSILALVNWP